MRLFLYEYASARTGAELPASIRREGRAMLAALADDARRLGAEVLSLGPGPEATERARFREQAAAASGAIIVAPEFNGLLETRVRWVGEAGGRLLSCAPSAIAAVADKLRLFRRWLSAGVPTPLAWEAGTDPLAPPPWVRKWRVGAGSQEMKLLTAPEPAPRGRAWLLQEFSPGQPASVAFLCGPDGFRLPLPPTLQQLSADGAFLYLGGVAPAPTKLHPRCLRLAGQALNVVAEELRGWVGVDLILGEADDGSGDRAIEINPRLTTSYLGLRRLTDANLLDLWLRIVAGEQPPSPAWRDGVVRFGATGEAKAEAASP